MKFFFQFIRNWPLCIGRFQRVTDANPWQVGAAQNIGIAFPSQFACLYLAAYFFSTCCNRFFTCLPQAECHFRVDRSSKWLTSGRAWTWLTDREDDGNNNMFFDEWQKLKLKVQKSFKLQLKKSLEWVVRCNRKLFYMSTRPLTLTTLT